MKEYWLRRRWQDFRFGHSIYLIFVMSFSNFVLIFHRLLIERIEALNEIFSDLWIFVLVFIAAYIPLSIIIGAWHRKTQIKVETEQTMLNNPFQAKIFRMLIDMIEGNATKEEIKKLREILTAIEKKSDYKFSKNDQNDTQL